MDSLFSLELCPQQDEFLPFPLLTAAQNKKGLVLRVPPVPALLATAQTPRQKSPESCRGGFQG